MGLARLYWRTHPFSKVSESKLPTTKKEDPGRSPGLKLFDILEFVSLIQPYTRLLYRQ